MRKSWFKKSICIFVAVILMTGGMIAARTDIERSEIPLATQDASSLNKLGIMLGTENGMELERNVTRAEALALISRTCGLVFDDVLISNLFDDVSMHHWAYDTIMKFYNAGYIHGTSETTFDPERTVTGREFVKILLTCMGYGDVVIENAYEIGEKSELLSNNFTKTVVYNNYELTRSDCARICFGALASFVEGDERELLYRILIEKGLYTEDDFVGVLFSGTPANKTEDEFGDVLVSYMPKDKNYMISPLSIKMALGLVANGAAGVTKQEILDACGIGDISEFNEDVKKMIEKYSKADILHLDISNSLWLNKDNSPFAFREEYLSDVKNYFEATVETVDNQNAVEKINGWAKEKTNGKIPTMINNSDFATYLANAVYFKAAWEDEFSEFATAKDTFTSRDGKTSELDFMNKKKYMQYFENEDKSVRGVKLDYMNMDSVQAFDGSYDVKRYDDIDISMYVFLADSYDFEPVKAAKNAEFESEYLKFSMPKFECEFEMKPHEILKQMGVSTAFSANFADFLPMVTKKGMYISDSVHKTYIKVDEKGTEAAAVTGFAGAMGALIKYPEPIEFILNRPFYYVIMDNINGEALFVGEYAFAS